MAHRLEALGQHMRALEDMEMTMLARIAAMGMVIILRAGFRVVDIAGRIMPALEELVLAVQQFGHQVAAACRQGLLDTQHLEAGRQYALQSYATQIRHHVHWTPHLRHRSEEHTSELQSLMRISY